MRASRHMHMREVIATMTSRPKLTIVSGDGVRPTVPDPQPQNQRSVEDRIGRATFTGSGDKHRVLTLYQTFRKEMALVACTAAVRSVALVIATRDAAKGLRSICCSQGRPRTGGHRRAPMTRSPRPAASRRALSMAYSARHLGRHVRHSGGHRICRSAPGGRCQWRSASRRPSLTWRRIFPSSRGRGLAPPRRRRRGAINRSVPPQCQWLDETEGVHPERKSPQLRLSYFRSRTRGEPHFCSPVWRSGYFSLALRVPRAERCHGRPAGRRVGLSAGRQRA